MAIELPLLADKYLKNQCTHQEAQIVLYWFSTEPGRSYLQEQLEKDSQLLRNDNLFISPVNVPSSKMLDVILTALEASAATSKYPGTAKIIEPALSIVPVRTAWFRQWYKAAALITGISLGLIMAFHYYSGRTISSTTRYGETARIILPDSSSVTLNGNSRIEYTVNWKNNETRQVKLKGEAFFSVKHKSGNQKFIVCISDTIQVMVLGTEFNISGRSRQTSIVLVSGSIRLDVQRNKTTTSLLMKPGESVGIVPLQPVLHKKKVDPALVTSWKDNKLMFDNTSVREICEWLKDTYGYQITVSDPKIMSQNITGSVPNQSIDMVLEGLEAILGVKFKRTKN